MKSSVERPDVSVCASPRSSSPGYFSWGDALCHDPLPMGGIAVALLLGTYALLQVPPSPPLLVAGFCGAALVYGADRALVSSPEDAVNHPDRRRWVQAHREWLVGEAALLLIVGGGAMVYLNRETLLGVGVVAVPAGLHLLRVGRSGRALKAMGLAKPLLVAGGWAVGATALPVLEAGRPLGIDAVAIAGYRLLFLLPNVLLVDWGDRAGDAASGLSSWTPLATRRGLRGTASLLLVFAVGGALGLAPRTTRPLLLWIDAVGPLLMLGAVWTLDPSRPRHRLLLDGLVGWPVVTALVAWGPWPSACWIWRLF